MMVNFSHGYRLNEDVLLIIAQYCDLKTLSAMMQTCKVSKSTY